MFQKTLALVCVLLLAPLHGEWLFSEFKEGPDVPVPSFVGYRPWSGGRYFVKMNEIDTYKPVVAKVTLHCDEASEFMISPYADFRGETWRKMQTELSWNMDPDKQFSVVWVIFKRYNEETGFYEVTSPVSYIVDRYDVTRKMLLLQNAYWDLTNSKIQTYTHIPYGGSKKISIHDRYGFYSTQIDNDFEVTKNLLVAFKEIEVNDTYTLSFLFQYWGGDDGVSGYKKIFKINQIFYGEDKSDYIAMEFDLTSTNMEYNFYRKSKEVLDFPKVTLKGKELESVFNYLVIDARGVDVNPSMYPFITDTSENPVVSIADYNNFLVPYATYIRSSRDEQINKFLKQRIKNYDKEGKRGIFISAMGSTGQNKTGLMVGQRDLRYLHANQKTLENISNGNLFIVVD